ncbi:DUF1097 domain-containing protein [Neisseriaceae bacterium CLB008]|nr:DUF1097 domain-containing protein [Neisseriaceae bacterium]
MKINWPLMISALVTGFLCGLWAGVAPRLNLSIWAGFAGCTAYFASGKHQLEGIKMTLYTTLLGSFTAFAMIWSGDNILSFLSPNMATGIAVGIIVGLIVLCGALDFVAFVPGIFVGCYSYFAIDGQWPLLIASLIAGTFLGWACDQGGTSLTQRLGLSQAPSQ